MFKSLIFLAVALVFVSMVAADSGKSSETSEVKEAMKNAFKNGIERFGGVVSNKHQENQEPKHSTGLGSKILSAYTKGLTALGGGKAALTEQYRKHHFTPLAPSVVPRDFGADSGKLNADKASRLFVPQRPLQYTTDRLHL